MQCNDRATCLFGILECGAEDFGQVQDLLIMRGRPYMPEEPEPEPNQLPGSCIAFTRNGKLQGIAYRCAACLSAGRPLYQMCNSSIFQVAGLASQAVCWMS